MAFSEYMSGVRAKIGTDLLLTPAAGVATFDEGGRLLLARHVHDGLWATPGGGVEPGESPLEAAIREVGEETGLLVQDCILFGAYGGPDFEVTYPDGTRTAYVVTMYGTTTFDGSLELQVDELREVAWVDQLSAEELPMPPDMRVIVPAAFAWLASTTTV